MVRRLASGGVVSIVGAALAVTGAGACSSSSTGVTVGVGADGGGSDSATAGNFQIEVPCNDDVSAIYADPGTLPSSPKGTILKCHVDADIAKADLQAAAAMSSADLPGYTGNNFTSGAHVYRVLYL